jgi:YesN/AraC family two-component response regulator
MVMEAIAFMKDLYQEEMTVSVLADRAKITSKYFGTIFKQTTGQNLSEYLTNIGEIAEKVGIGDIYYFSKLFKKIEGLSPKRYRDSLLWLNHQRLTGRSEVFFEDYIHDNY